MRKIIIASMAAAAFTPYPTSQSNNIGERFAIGWQDQSTWPGDVAADDHRVRQALPD